jgi:hypothetical protein
MMSDIRTDAELRYHLQNWAAGQPLPKINREALIQAAREQRINSENSASLNLTEFSEHLLSMALVNRADNRIVNLRPIY